MLANLHCHTFRCRHAAKVPDRDFAEAAIAAGYRTLGFSDHCPWPWAPGEVPEGYRSGIRMDASETGEYVESLLSLRAECAGRLDVLIGFEVEHQPARIAAQDELFSRFPLDYLIMGQHFFGDEWEADWSGNPTEDESRLSRYVDLCIEGLSSGRYLYLAHPDTLRFVGDDRIYARHMGRLCDFMRDHGFPVEMNLLGLADGRHYPSERFLRVVAEHGNWATVGVDSHRPEALLGAAPVEARAREMCEKFGIEMREPPLPLRAAR